MGGRRDRGTEGQAEARTCAALRRPRAFRPDFSHAPRPVGTQRARLSAHTRIGLLAFWCFTDTAPTQWWTETNEAKGSRDRLPQWPLCLLWPWTASHSGAPASTCPARGGSACAKAPLGPALTPPLPAMFCLDSCPAMGSLVDHIFTQQTQVLWSGPEPGARGRDGGHSELRDSRALCAAKAMREGEEGKGQPCSGSPGLVPPRRWRGDGEVPGERVDPTCCAATQPSLPSFLSPLKFHGKTRKAGKVVLAKARRPPSRLPRGELPKTQVGLARWGLAGPGDRRLWSRLRTRACGVFLESGWLAQRWLCLGKAGRARTARGVQVDRQLSHHLMSCGRFAGSGGRKCG